MRRPESKKARAKRVERNERERRRRRADARRSTTDEAQYDALSVMSGPGEPERPGTSYPGELGEFVPVAPDLTDELNAYTCERCGGTIVTINRQPGTTPMMIRCRAEGACGGNMHSRWYRDVTGTPTFEWRRPTPGEYRKLSPAMRAHVDRGGLCIYAMVPTTTKTEGLGS